jgi:hypothetical protein
MQQMLWLRGSSVSNMACTAVALCTHSRALPTVVLSLSHISALIDSASHRMTVPHHSPCYSDCVVGEVAEATDRPEQLYVLRPNPSGSLAPAGAGSASLDEQLARMSMVSGASTSGCCTVLVTGSQLVRCVAQSVTEAVWAGLSAGLEPHSVYMSTPMYGTRRSQYSGRTVNLIHSFIHAVTLTAACRGRRPPTVLRPGCCWLGSVSSFCRRLSQPRSGLSIIGPPLMRLS